MTEALFTFRPLRVIAWDIIADWRNMSPHAKPYVRAMEQLASINEDFGYDSGRSIVGYFLANASSWRGPTARAIKAELNLMLKAAR